jgi:hypothetical protein
LLRGDLKLQWTVVEWRWRDGELVSVVMMIHCGACDVELKIGN